MKLKTLFKDFEDIEIKGCKDIEISSISNDSRYVFINSLFIAKKGFSDDGSKYIHDAITSGAKSILTDIYDPFLKNITQIICKDPNILEADLAAKFYNNPSKNLYSIAITGTNGKTTTSYLIKHILDENNIKTGLLGTIEYIYSDSKQTASLTTPSSIELQKYFKEMKNSNFKAFCLEASSHGIDQNRLKNIDFNTAIFTNITVDHLDYHKTFENYKIAKKKLFDSLTEDAFSIINLDDPNAFFMISNTKSKIFTYAIDNKADLKAENIKFSIENTMFNLIYENQRYEVKTSLIGKFNVSNILASISLAITKNIKIENIINSIESFKSVKGRLEKVNSNKPFSIFIDFSHTDDALKNVLQTLNNIKKNKIICVFGAGGNRDKSKRELLAKASEKYSDITIEDPHLIIEDIKKGFSKDFKYYVEVDREKAILKAIKIAQKDDIILIAGKGHENYQILKNQKIYFDDKKIAEEICLTL